MAKVTGPLLSGEAHGEFGQAIIFFGPGYVKNTFTPRNPRSPAQGNVRQRLNAAQKALVKVHLVARRDVFGVDGPRTYKAPMLKFMLQFDYFYYTECSRRWAGEVIEDLFIPTPMTQEQRDEWESAGTLYGLVPYHLSYASDPVLSPGFVFHWLSFVWFAEVNTLGIAAAEFDQPLTWLEYLTRDPA